MKPPRIRVLAELVYPRQCFECGAAPGDTYRYLCWDCAARIHWLREPMCEQCGEPVEGRVDSRFRCHLCIDQPRHFDRARSVTRFDGTVREAIHRLKYRDAIWMVDDLARILEAGWQTFLAGEPVDAVCPVPLHRVRRRTRGFNQAALLGRTLARRLGLRFAPRCLARTRPTESQIRLTARQRADNMRGAFACPRPASAKGRTLLLIDDVMTTGSTCSEAARALKDAGAKRVLVLTVARG